jgi:hypothetical protein
MSDSVIALDLFREQSVLTGQRVRLEPLTPAVLDDYLGALANPEIAVAPGTQTVIMLSPWGSRDTRAISTVNRRRSTPKFPALPGRRRLPCR